ncbi:MAG TPA: HAD family hydrolase [Candidatus Binatia bacterium]|nr:HAD family hydrolase [Candidatus Binatia bacterium]
MATLIAFDVDGVLYSSEPFIADAYRESIERVNARRPGSFARVPSTRDILDHIGWPVATILKRLFPRVDREAVELLHAATLDVICRRVAEREGRLYPGVHEALEMLGEAGHLLAVASNGRRRYVETILDTYGMAHLFVEPITADERGTKPMVLREYLETYDITPIAAVMVGDRASDVEAAQAVSCHFIGCDYGHGYRHEIEGAGPVVNHLREVPSAVVYLLRG